ncbi:MAG: hypothetical protein HGA42_19770 [Nostocales cyanobacterium W4_Combined_metabat2_030]|nr:hypothetical protein [Nostocales cyanobacterium W4_Combined_metabat2_030]
MKTNFLTLLAIMMLVTFSANAQLGGALNKMKDKATGSSSSSFDGSKVQPDAAIQNVERNLKSITESYYADYQSKGMSFLNNDAQLWFIRKVMEVSRYYYSGGKMGYHGGGLVCELGAAQQDPRYVALAPKFKDAEEKVKEMEKAKGYEFVECTDNNIIFKEIKTGRVLSADESSKI